jgi:hypothetical protein
MNALWSINLETLEFFYEMLAEVEKDAKRELSTEEREIVFLQLMKSKGIKPSGNTELNKQELINELVSKGKNILSIDKEGYKITKKKEIEE